MNSVTEVTRDDLCAEDGDSFPQDLVYWVTPPSNGHLALKSAPGRSVRNFTQAQIDEGRLVFVHSGKSQSRVKLLCSEQRVMRLSNLRTAD